MLRDVSVDKLNAVLASAEEATGPNEAELRIVTLDEFVAVEEQGGDAVLGTQDAALISAAGDVMVYGDGGVGKTTLVVDLGCHLAAGDNWLGIEVGRPVRVLVIENEGPRPQFRRKLARKREAWSGSEIGDRLLVFEEPWSGFSFGDPVWRERLAEVIREREIDVVTIGPLTASGMDLPGTLQECREFIALVKEVRDLAGRRFVNLVVHHENSGGKVSGAWEGVGDTLVHVTQQGRGKLRLYVQKARWSSEHHGETIHLAWTAGEGFERVAGEAPRPERTWDEIAAFVLEHGGCAWNEVASAVSGERSYLTRRRDAMLAEGLLINAGTPREFSLWHRDDPARPPIDTSGSDPRIGGESPDSDTRGGDTAGGSRRSDKAGTDRETPRDRDGKGARF